MLAHPKEKVNYFINCSAFFAKNAARDILIKSGIIKGRMHREIAEHRFFEPDR